jgi:beta-galactosidase
MKKPLLLLLAAFLGAFASARAQRQVTDLATGWKFILQDAAPDAPVAGWQDVTVPHTWNTSNEESVPVPADAAPAQGGLVPHYFRGVGWYDHALDIPAAWQGRRVFIQFEAASEVAAVYLNGRPVGGHRGSFTAFCLELTAGLKFGERNDLRVRVDNALNREVAPLSGDFNIDGGIYRPVHLIVTDPVCVTPLEHASPGVFLTTRVLAAKEARVEVRTLLSNGSPQAAAVELIAEIKDATGQTVGTARTQVDLPATATAQPVVQDVVLTAPHLWKGRQDPYLYAASVRVLRNGHAVDEVVQPLGLRTVAITEAQGFLLNGQPYPIYGIDCHQDLKDHGWAMSPADHDRDVQLILDMGVTAIRLAHYPQSEYLHSLCDRAGILLWNEVSFVNRVPDPREDPAAPSPTTLAFRANLEEQLRELILQRYNHPAAAFWGLFNELGTGTTDAVALPIVRRLNELAHQLDPSRLTVSASNHPQNQTNLVADRPCYNIYPGWYSLLEKADAGKLIDEIYAQHHRRIALSEYGAGSNPAQHQEGALTPPKANGGLQHPEEWESYVHERDWAQIRNNPKLWGSFIWVMFDFASAGRSEGGQPGINDKGMVTQDRQIRKDAYFFYQANWTDRPMVYVTSRRDTPRRTALTDVKVYSNCPEVELFLNGQSLGRVKPDELRIARWSAVTLKAGTNAVRAVGLADGPSVSDDCVWTLAEPGP